MGSGVLAMKKTEFELVEMYWKNPEYNERMSFAAFRKLVDVLSEPEPEPTPPAEYGKRYWVVEGKFEGVSRYVNAKTCRWVDNIHEATKYKNKDLCARVWNELNRIGEVTEHMDVSEDKNSVKLKISASEQFEKEHYKEEPEQVSAEKILMKHFPLLPKSSNRDGIDRIINAMREFHTQSIILPDAELLEKANPIPFEFSGTIQELQMSWHKMYMKGIQDTLTEVKLLNDLK